MVIENRKYDLLNKTPAVDMWFCCLTPEKCENIYQQWCAVTETEGDAMIRNVLLVDAKESEIIRLFCNPYSFYIKGTHQQEIPEHKIDHYFTRAVVYPLYPSHSMMGLGKMGLPASFDELADTVWQCLYAAKCKGLLVTLDQLEDTILCCLHGAKKPDQNKCSSCGSSSENLMKCFHCQSAHAIL